MNSMNYIVCVRCFTFNHAPYIEDALDGFCMQKTSFPFVCTIVDDASSDGEQDIIKNYVHDHFDLEDKSIVRREETDDYILIFAQHKTNRNCYFAVFYLKYNHYSRPEVKDNKFLYISKWYDNAKYIALCEGDDYWIDPCKLQKQVNTMETHPECSMTVSNNYSYNVELDKFEVANPVPINECRFLTMSELLREEGGLIPTASMCFRGDLLRTKPFEFSTPHVGDRPLRMWCAINGPVFYDANAMTVYRFGSVGSFSQRTRSNFNYAKDVLVSMNEFYDYFDKYTQYAYKDDVAYMKSREEYLFYIRIGSYKRFLTCYYKAFPFVKKVKILIHYVLDILSPKISLRLSKLVMSSSISKTEILGRRNL